MSETPESRWKGRSVDEIAEAVRLIALGANGGDCFNALCIEFGAASVEKSHRHLKPVFQTDELCAAIHAALNPPPPFDAQGAHLGALLFEADNILQTALSATWSLPSIVSELKKRLPVCARLTLERMPTNESMWQCWISSPHAGQSFRDTAPAIAELRALAAWFRAGKGGE